jgi:hypothetical protein
MASTTLPGGTFKLADDLILTRMGYGAMQLAGPHVFGPPKDQPGNFYFDASDLRRRIISARLRSELFTASAFGNAFATSGSNTTTLVPRP